MFKTQRNHAGKFLVALAAVCAAGLPVAVQADPLTGALIGGIVGSRFGQGNGQIAATVVGAAVGAELGGHGDAPAPAYVEYRASPPPVYYPQPVYGYPQYRQHHHHHYAQPAYYPALPPGTVIVMPPPRVYYGY